MRRLFTWRVNLYRLIVGAVVLATVIPSWQSGTGEVARGNRVHSRRHRRRGGWQAFAVHPKMAAWLIEP